MWSLTVVLGVLAAAVPHHGEELKFPPWFEFGAASSAYQVEGGWNASDKGENMIDSTVHMHFELIIDHANGDVSCHSYRFWKRDVEMLEELGVDFYRLLVAHIQHQPVISRKSMLHLARGFTTSFAKRQSVLISFSFMIFGSAANMASAVSLQSGDSLMPSLALWKSGWQNPLVSEWFADYARVAFKLFGDRVKTFITINEPIMICSLVMNFVGQYDSEIAPYLCAKNVIISHAKAWRIYDKEFRNKFHGKVSLSNLIFWMVPSTSDVGKNPSNTQIALEYSAGIYSHPVYSKEGGWPPLLEKLMAEKSKGEGYTSSRLPPFTEEEKEYVKGTFDFYGLNYYTGRTVRSAKPGEAIGDFPVDGLKEFNLILDVVPAPRAPGVDWFFDYPEGLRYTLRWLKEQYGDVEIVIAENGYPETGSNLEDDHRIECLNKNMGVVLRAIYEDGVNITKYTVWSLMDSFEWVYGYTSKFGLYQVDFNDPMRTRTPRKSARYYADVIKNRSLKLCSDVTCITHERGKEGINEKHEL